LVKPFTCPECGGETFTPVKSWILAPKGRNGGRIRISIYECPRCFRRWRVREEVKAEADVP